MGIELGRLHSNDKVMTDMLWLPGDHGHRTPCQPCSLSCALEKQSESAVNLAQGSYCTFGMSLQPFFTFKSVSADQQEGHQLCVAGPSQYARYAGLPCNFIYFFHAADINLIVHIKTFYVPPIALHQHMSTELGSGHKCGDTMPHLQVSLAAADACRLQRSSLPQSHQSGRPQCCPL